MLDAARPRRRLLTAAATLWLLAAAPAPAQVTALMMPDSTNDRVVLFDPVTGAVVNNNYFPLVAGSTPVHALQVGNEIWVSEQLGDRVARYSLTGTALGQVGGGPTGGLDNVRGMGLIGGVVYVTNGGTANGAPSANAVIRYTTAGALIDSFPTVGLAPSPFGVLANQGGVLVSSSSGTDDIHRFSLTGTPLGTFQNGTTLNFVEQMTYAANGDVLTAGFSSNNVVRLNPTTGAVVGQFAAAGARGVYQLGNGNILWTSGAGVSVYDVALGTSSQVYAGGGRYLDLVTFTSVPEPSGLALIGAAAIGLRLWRRCRRVTPPNPS